MDFSQIVTEAGFVSNYPAYVIERSTLEDIRITRTLLYYERMKDEGRNFFIELASSAFPEIA
jgi:hypothetical protein